MGLMQRCAADNTKAALAIGIHVSNQVSIAWAMSAALAGLAGTLLATLNGLSLGLADIGMIAFPVVVVGGLTSLGGALVSGLLLGMLQAFTDGFLTPSLEDFLRTHTSIYSVGALQQVVPYALLVLMLLLRPQGLFGRRGTERV
jgi:branched-chain amino acid transport system permease protein